MYLNLDSARFPFGFARENLVSRPEEIPFADRNQLAPFTAISPQEISGDCNALNPRGQNFGGPVVRQKINCLTFGNPSRECFEQKLPAAWLRRRGSLRLFLLVNDFRLHINRLPPKLGRLFRFLRIFPVFQRQKKPQESLNVKIAVHPMPPFLSKRHNDQLCERGYHKWTCLVKCAGASSDGSVHGRALKTGRMFFLSPAKRI